MRSVLRGLVLLAGILLLLGVAAAAQSWFRSRGEAILSMAEQVPAEAQLFVAADLKGEWSLRETAARFREFLLPLDGGSFQELEAELGYRIDTVAGWLAPRGFLVVLPGKTGQRPAEIVVALEAENPEALEGMIRYVTERSGLSTSALEPPVHQVRDGQAPVLVWAFHQRLLLISSSAEALGSCLRPTAPLAREENFRQAWREVTVEKGVFLYAPVRPTARLIALRAPELAAELSSIPYLVGAADFREGEVLSQGFLRIDRGSRLAEALLATPASVSPEGARFAPAGWDSYVALDVRYLVEAGFKLAGLHPELRDGAETAAGWFEVMVGIRLSDLWQAITGELGVSTNLLQMFSEGVERWEGQVPEKPADRAAAPDDAGHDPDLQILAALRLTDRAAAERLASTLLDRHQITAEPSGPDGIVSLPEAGISYRFTDQYLLLYYGSQAGAVLNPGPAAAGLLPRIRARQETDPGGTLLFSYVDLRSTLDRLMESLKGMAAGDPEVASWLEKLVRFSRSMSRADTLTRVTLERNGIRYASSSPPEGISLAAGVALFAVAKRAAADRAGVRRAESCVANVRQIGTALEMYSTDYAGMYPGELSRLTPDYLRSIPVCPEAGYDTYTEGYRSATQPDAYTVMCEGYSHVEAGYKPDRPMHTSYLGPVRD